MLNYVEVAGSWGAPGNESAVRGPRCVAQPAGAGPHSLTLSLVCVITSFVHNHNTQRLEKYSMFSACARYARSLGPHAPIRIITGWLARNFRSLVRVAVFMKAQSLTGGCDDLLFFGAFALWKASFSRLRFCWPLT
jgi:hypothetical protein